MYVFPLPLKTQYRIVAVLLFTLASCAKTGPAEPGGEGIRVIEKDFVFGPRQPFAQCHASTLLRTNDGKFLVAFFGGTKEEDRDVGIWLSRGYPKHWSTPTEIVKLREEAHWNPVLFKAPSGEIFLYFKVGKTTDLWETWFMTSKDNGTTWSAAKELVPGDVGGRGPVRNKPIVLSNGHWLAPASNELNNVWNAFVDRSEDSGKTWRATPFLELNRDSISGEGVIQPALWETMHGNVHMLLRSSAGILCRSDSKDFGRTWSSIYKTNLPNPNSGIDLTQMQDSSLVLAYNHTGKNWGARNRISLSRSRDGGNTWDTPLVLENGIPANEFSYPSIICFGDTLAITYTWNRQTIAFWKLRVKS